eukprot:gnl/TRDRNA2_/TRDRNA2_137141_c1_seq1.p1 gnl/TRDRNA2_/TRDRNA2_137141_c1~~gnl/TRDRNA2_/TRDRNA2_137141_c1_seq1.p1  ORF type:complete len:491 (-),score=62.06 gnl/TRDRNA2_/TRDRNA2_137141_c1_seq1:110-1468(-)
MPFAMEIMEMLSAMMQEKPEHVDAASALRSLRELSLEYSWAEIASATENFSETRELGRGAFGAVYRGTLSEGTDVAVKVIEAPVGGGFEEEVRMLSRCRHPNVVLLLGFALDTTGDDQASNTVAPPRRALVYELLRGGDVASRLRSCGVNGHGAPSDTSCDFPWQERLRTAMGLARGLAHLHKHRPEIFHRDIKLANLLFGADGTVKIADFGLACMSRFSGNPWATVQSTAGTLGYADPLYGRTGIVTEANEVYSMGMVLFELLTGQPPALVSADGRDWKYFCEELKLNEDGAKKRVLQHLDTRAAWPMHTAATLTTLALQCVHEDTDRRPSFLDLASILQDVTTAGTLAEIQRPLSLNPSRRQAPPVAAGNFPQCRVHTPHAGCPPALVQLRPSVQQSQVAAAAKAVPPVGKNGIQRANSWGPVAPVCTEAIPPLAVLGAACRVNLRIQGQ